MWVDLAGKWVDSLTMPIDFVPLLFLQKWVDGTAFTGSLWDH